MTRLHPWKIKIEFLLEISVLPAVSICVPMIAEEIPYVIVFLHLGLEKLHELRNVFIARQRISASNLNVDSVAIRKLLR